MQFSPQLQRATLIKRYKRFLADVELADGNVITLHCPNTGSMTGCAEPGSQVLYSWNDNGKRKYPGTWELVNVGGHWITVNTNMANRLVKEAIESEAFPLFEGLESCQAEVKYGDENSRIDFLLTKQDGTKVYVEVKSVTLLENGMGFFPDAVTSRGQKHVRELMQMRQQGHDAVLLFCAQHQGIHSVKCARHIDSEYSDLVLRAADLGVKVVAFKSDISPDSMALTKEIPVEWD